MRRCWAVLALWCLSTVSAQAQSRTDPAGADARLELSSGFSAREAIHRQTIALTYGGFSPGYLRLRGAYFFPNSPFGLSADALWEQFHISGTGVGGTNVRDSGLYEQKVTSDRLSVSGAARSRLGGSAWAELHVGLGTMAFPLLRFASQGLQIDKPRATGLVTMARFDWSWTQSLSSALRLRMVPVSAASGSGYSQVREYGAGAQLAFGALPLLGMKWALLLDYELSLLTGLSGQGNLRLSSHQFGLGFHGGWSRQSAAQTSALGMLAGTVVLEHNKPAFGARVDLASGLSTTTDAQGRFAFSALTPGEMTVVTSLTGYRTAKTALTVSAGQETTARIDLEKPTGPGVIRGQVLTQAADAKAQTPVADALVEAGATSVRTDRNGRFILEQQGPGPVPLKLSARGYKPAREVVSVPPEAEASVDIPMQKAAAPLLASIRGQIRSLNGSPTRARIRIVEARIATRSDKAGHFLVRVPGGRYTVFVEAAGFISQSKPVEVADGDQAIFDIALSPEEP